MKNIIITKELNKQLKERKCSRPKKRKDLWKVFLN